MTDQPTNAVNPQKAIAAQQVSNVFNSVTSFLQSLAHEAEEGKILLTEELNDARKALHVASFWAIQHVMRHGIPTPKAANDVAADPAPTPPAAATPTDAPKAENAV